MSYVKKERLLEWLNNVLQDEVQVDIEARTTNRFIYSTDNEFPVDRLEDSMDVVIINNLTKLNIGEKK